MPKQTTPLDIRVRLGKPQDAEAFVAFNRALALETEGKTLALEHIAPGVRAVFDDPAHGFYVVAETQARIAGGLMVTYEWSDWRNGLFWWVQSVYVAPQYRGRGIYTRLYEFVRDRARLDDGVRGLRLCVDRDNERAQRVYAALGMSESNYLLYEEML